MAAEDVALLGQERRAGPPLAAEPCENCNVVGVWLVALQQSCLHQGGHLRKICQRSKQWGSQGHLQLFATRKDVPGLQAAGTELLPCGAARMLKYAGHAGACGHAHRCG